MFKYFQDYYWKNGKPYGRNEVNPSVSPTSYKIVVDPYFKRFSIEKYLFSNFDKIIYDSILLDFRLLTLEDQTAWQRERLKEEKNSSTTLLRNQDDRVILTESLIFENNQCRSCIIRSIHGVRLSTHRMYYRHVNDQFDGVVLYDNEERIVMMKIYDIDVLTKEFTNLLFEEWDIQRYETLDDILHSFPLTKHASSLI
ncbi:MAG: hypothetical protein ACH350_05945 [Parachlamydiaceae bacterium]